MSNNNFMGWKLWDPSAQGGCGSVIISWNVIWNKEQFPGLSKDTHNPIPAHFGCIDTKTPAASKLSLPASTEECKEYSDNQEGGSLPLPALVPSNNNPAEQPSLPKLPSLFSDAPPLLPPALRTPPCAATALHMPDTLQPPQHQSALHLACPHIPELLLLLETLCHSFLETPEPL
jgi:hypothetical protein